MNFKCNIDPSSGGQDTPAVIYVPPEGWCIKLCDYQSHSAEYHIYARPRIVDYQFFF